MEQPIWIVVVLVVFWTGLLVTAAVSAVHRRKLCRERVTAGRPVPALDDPFLTRQPFGLGSGGGFG